MIHLLFIGYGAGEDVTLGPADSFRISGNFIRDTESGEILARYHHHYWEVKGKHFTRYDCHDSVMLHFEDNEGGKTDIYGPFASLSAADGSMHVGDRLVAKFMDPNLLWHDIESDTYWPNLILSSPRS